MAISPSPVAKVFYTVGIVSLALGAAYHLTDAHWKGREFYVREIDKIILSIDHHARCLFSAQSDDEYLARQNDAHDAYLKQCDWINNNIGGVTMHRFAGANKDVDFPDKPDLSAVINERRREWLSRLRGRVDFLEEIKEREAWPKSSKELVKG